MPSNSSHTPPPSAFSHIYKNYLKKNNYKFNFNPKKINDKNLKPWFTMPFNAILDNLLNKKYIGFEYGSGASTFYFSRRVSKIYSIEYYKNFYETLIKLKLPKNCKLFCNNIKEEVEKKYKNNFYFKKHINSIKDLKHSKKNKFFLLKHGFISKDYRCINYASKILEFKNNYFDFISIDGQARELCVKYAVNKLKRNGFIIFDNSDRGQYNRIFNFLRKKNFYRVDFWGIGNYRSYEWCTSIFFKKISILDIFYKTNKKKVIYDMGKLQK
jgi:hypothetical protein